MTSPHEIVNPASMAPPRGFAHAVTAGPARTVYLGGQAAHDAKGEIRSDDLVEQFDRAASNVVEALEAAGGSPEHLVSMQIFVTDIGAYRSSLEAIGKSYRKHFGAHYPAMGLFAVEALFDARALVELMGVAVIPEET